MDLRLPGTNGIEVMLQSIRNDLPIIVMTAHGDIQVAVRAMKAGATDFLEKPYSEEALLAAIEAAFASARASVRAEEIADATRRVDSLSPREREVLEGLIDGRSNKVIAHQFGLSAPHRGQPRVHDGAPGHASTCRSASPRHHGAARLTAI